MFLVLAGMMGQEEEEEDSWIDVLDDVVVV